MSISSGSLCNDALVGLVLASLLAAPAFYADGALRYVASCSQEARGMARLAALVQGSAGCCVEEIKRIEDARDVLWMLRKVGAVAAHGALFARVADGRWTRR